MKFTIVVVCVAFVVPSLVGIVVGQNPIPHRPPRGFVYPSSDNCNAPVEFTAFVDLICPDCKQAWPTFEKVAEYYNNGSTVQVSFETIIFPLPYHRAAFPAAQASYILRLLKGAAAYKWFDYIFDHQNKYYNGVILNTKQSEIYTMLAEDIAAATGVSKSDILAHFKESDPSREEAIVMWKYACFRTVSGTPTVFINGVMVDFSLSWTLDDWRQVIDPLLTA
jgi:protein-disulfide isomerase